MDTTKGIHAVGIVGNHVVTAQSLLFDVMVGSGHIKVKYGHQQRPHEEELNRD